MAAGVNGAAWRLTLNYASGEYKLQLWAMDNTGNWVTGAQIPIQDTSQVIMVENKALANNGWVKLWVNGTLAGTVANVNNDLQTVDNFSLGAVQTIDAGTSSTIYFDAVETYETVQ